MNVFWLHENPRQCAAMHCDQHVIKMLSEYAQILGEALRINGRDEEWLANGYENHPQTQWAAESYSNWTELYDLAEALWEEKLYRYGPPHKAWTERLAPITEDMLSALPANGSTPKPFTAGDLELSGVNIYTKYRWYYLTVKAPWARYTERKPPTWLEGSVMHDGLPEAVL